MSNNSSHGEHCFVSSLLFPKVSQHIHRAINLSHIYASPTFSLPLLQYVVSERSLRAHWFSSGEGRCVKPCTDRIDNAGLNIALRQDIFRSVYSAVTRTLPQLKTGTGGGASTATLSLRDYFPYWICKKTGVDDAPSAWFCAEKLIVKLSDDISWSWFQWRVGFSFTTLGNHTTRSLLRATSLQVCSFSLRWTIALFWLQGVLTWCNHISHCYICSSTVT